jgi:hypothetical protein
MKKFIVTVNYEFNNGWTANDTFVVGHDDSCHNNFSSNRLL